MSDPPAASTEAGSAARVLAARLAGRGYQVWFPPGRDPATFKVTGLPGGPDVEVSAGDDGRASCHYTGCTRARAASVIARLPAPGHPGVPALIGDTLTATWDGIEVEWHYLPPHQERSACPELAAAALLAHLAVLDGRHHDGEDDRR
jgi:hypothetical protein